MAKLSAHGEEVWRVKRERENGAEAPTVRDSTEYSMRADGALLEKRSAVFRDKFDPSGVRHHTWGWKLFRRKADPEAAKAALLKAGYTEVRS